MHRIVNAEARKAADITLEQAKAALDLARVYYRVWKSTGSVGCRRKYREKLEDCRILTALARAEILIS